MPAQFAPSPVTFHLSLNVADLGRSVAFFQTVFGVEAAKRRADYAKFEVENPPLVLSLEPMTPAGRGALNHVGFRMQNATELVELQRRLEMSGLSSQREEGVECCYSRQTKFWLHDPDENLWEFYVLEEDIDHRGAGQSLEVVMPQAKAAGPPSEPIRCQAAVKKTWGHRIGQSTVVPENLANDTVEEVLLQGTFNDAIPERDAEKLLDRVLHLLAPGGRVAVHCLTADRPLEREISLPGPASVVRHVPVDLDLLKRLEDAGFVNLRLTKFAGKPCFALGGVEMRETMIEGFKPRAADDSQPVHLVYKGPARDVTLDTGHVLRRGERTALPAAIWDELATTSLAEQLVLIEPTSAPVKCTL